MVNHSNLIITITKIHQVKIDVYVVPLLFRWPRSAPPLFNSRIATAGHDTWYDVRRTKSTLSL